jgi:hypothetical protein
MLLARPLAIATPMAGGQCFGPYANSLLQFKCWAAQEGIPVEYLSLFNESAITRARNWCVNEFMHGSCTHLLFWDADIECQPDAVVTLLALAGDDKDVVCGLYPKKQICWDKVAAAVKSGVPANELADHASDLVFNNRGLKGTFDLFEPLEVEECGTGFMMIQRRVFDQFAEAYPDLWYASDGRESKRAPGKILCAFENAIEEGTHRYLTEDYNFCRLVRQAGMKVWVAPWLNLNHYGIAKFVGNPQALSSLANPAASRGEQVERT